MDFALGIECAFGGGYDYNDTIARSAPQEGCHFGEKERWAERPVCLPSPAPYSLSPSHSILSWETQVNHYREPLGWDLDPSQAYALDGQMLEDVHIMQQRIYENTLGTRHNAPSQYSMEFGRDTTLRYPNVTPTLPSSNVEAECLSNRMNAFHSPRILPARLQRPSELRELSDTSTSPSPSFSIGTPTLDGKALDADGSQDGEFNESTMSKYGSLNNDGTWSCAYNGCKSQCKFRRRCDLRKHHVRHIKKLFCRFPGCVHGNTGGFSSNKDRARHEGKHNPTIRCISEDCKRVFSRMDNMKDHFKRVHEYDGIQGKRR